MDIFSRLYLFFHCDGEKRSQLRSVLEKKKHFGQQGVQSGRRVTFAVPPAHCAWSYKGPTAAGGRSLRGLKVLQGDGRNRAAPSPPKAVRSLTQFS